MKGQGKKKRLTTSCGEQPLCLGKEIELFGWMTARKEGEKRRERTILNQDQYFEKPQRARESGGRKKEKRERGGR